MFAMIQSLDTAILLWIQSCIRIPAFNQAVTFLTSLGNSGAVWLTIAVALLFFKKTRTTGLLCLLSLALSFLVNNMILKPMVGRIRPYEVIQGLTCLIPPEKDLSFPSGHAGSAFAAAVVLLLLLPKTAGIPALVLACLISLSRLYVGVHYPSDVICGALVGTACALAVVRNHKNKKIGKESLRQE